MIFFVDFFVSHHSYKDKAHKQSIARWHDNIQIDHTNGLYIPVKEATTVRATAAAAATTTTTTTTI